MIFKLIAERLALELTICNVPKRIQIKTFVPRALQCCGCKFPDPRSRCFVLLGHINRVINTHFFNYYLDCFILLRMHQTKNVYDNIGKDMCTQSVKVKIPGKEHVCVVILVM